MKRPLLLALAAAGLLSGCGDPTPSTPLAPDVPPPDTRKFSSGDIDRFHQQDQAGGPRHTPGASTPPRP